ncbi:uncharacterized protein C8R40DRAFT_1168663 [Lentinula edodes]|uniref:uncharacterized protein n=1 Tax=Lentinula edodes TaxID=5353 RepID=UPI001E8EE0EE|nr:uncharacterized protein C8R40DRAFT_1168663 [Lentinula edodes]KAH7877324.1 hypothetical protein C8R40DRAFT_1168663 [Lentinula edodes]
MSKIKAIAPESLSSQEMITCELELSHKRKTRTKKPNVQDLIGEKLAKSKTLHEQRVIVQAKLDLLHKFKQSHRQYAGPSNATVNPQEERGQNASNSDESDLTDIDEEDQTVTTGKHNIKDSSKHAIRNGRRGIEKQGQLSEAPTKAHIDIERAEYAFITETDQKAALIGSSTEPRIGDPKEIQATEMKAAYVDKGSSQTQDTQNLVDSEKPVGMGE